VYVWYHAGRRCQNHDERPWFCKVTLCNLISST
jgi:hypothetical protein